MEKDDCAVQIDAASVIDILRQLEKAVSKINPVNQIDEAKRKRSIVAFFKKLRNGTIPDKLQDRAFHLYYAIANKQVQIIESIKESERKEKKERLDQWILYGMEIAVFVAINVLVAIGLFTEIAVARLFVCLLAYTVAFCALLFFHVREYDRVERIVQKVLKQFFNSDIEK